VLEKHAIWWRDQLSGWTLVEVNGILEARVHISRSALARPSVWLQTTTVETPHILEVFFCFDSRVVLSRLRLRQYDDSLR
jgi:hypothetical protein